MGIDVRTNSAWHDVSSASARINGSWHTIKEGYQRRNGAWEQVWPSYKDYGGDSPRLDTNGFIDLYGYIANSYSSTSVYHSTEERACTSSRAAFGGASTFGDRYFYFSTAEPFDARGYNYLASLMTVRISTDQSSSGSYHQFSIYPFISFASAPDVGEGLGEVNIDGTLISCYPMYDTGYLAYTFVDLTNCNITDLYLRIGYVYDTTWTSSSYTSYGNLVVQDSDTRGIYLYKNKSDCPFDGSDTSYGWSWTLTY